MTPDEAAYLQYDALDADDTARVDTRFAFARGYQAALTSTRLCGAIARFEGQGPLRCDRPLGHTDLHRYTASSTGMTPDQTAAALDGLASNGPAQVYAMGYQAGRVEAFAAQAATAVESATSELELLAAGGYTAEQQARADAIAAASHVLAAAVRSGELVVIKEGDGILGLSAALVKLARQPATWIEHGDPPKACAPIPCPPFEQTNLTVEHRFDCSDVNGRIRASCPCGWTTEDAVKSVDAAYGLWVDHAESGRTFDRHVDAALDIVRGNPDLGDGALEAAKLAQPRARPAQP